MRWPQGWHWIDRLFLWLVLAGVAGAVSMGWLVWLGCVIGVDGLCPAPTNGG